MPSVWPRVTEAVDKLSHDRAGVDGKLVQSR